eukprot:2330216-Rhodomonas_salina.3
MECAVRTWRILLSAYALAMECAVLGCAICLRACYGMRGTGIAYGGGVPPSAGGAAPASAAPVRTVRYLSTAHRAAPVRTIRYTSTGYWVAVA